MTDNKIIAVMGATGNQGGSLALAILNDPARTFQVRAVTRNPDSAKAAELKRLGAEIVKADVNDPESLTQALQGAYGAFLVTFYWEHLSADLEQTHARNLADAAKAVGVQHVIWSTLDDTRDLIATENGRFPTLQGIYKVPHADAKGETNSYFKELGLPATFLNTSFFWENFIYFGLGPQKDKTGKWVLTLPMGERKMAGIAAEDIGKTAYGIFKKGLSTIGTTVGIMGEALTGEEMADAMTKATGQPVAYRPLSPVAFRNSGVPGADDLANMFQYYQEYGEQFLSGRSIPATRQFNPSLQSFKEWLANNGPYLLPE
jgi:uncharacterized protein YbjT (DUF2867 family)